MSTQFDDPAFNSNLYLNPTEQDLLITALNSNKSSNGTNSAQMNGIKSTPKRSATNDSQASPSLSTPGGDSFNGMPVDTSPYLNYDLNDANFDWDINGDLIGDMPGDDSGKSDDAHDDVDSGDKRKSPEDDDAEDGGGKRREGDDKGKNKPGRKPLTSEPTTKRKAQNRAAQRAFRERKERHLKDLESKVDDLEKASESANHENGLLRAQVERLQSELKEYRKRLSLSVNSSKTSPTTSSTGLSSKTNWDLNNNFQFAFPKFGPIGTNPNSTDTSNNRSGSFPTVSPTSSGKSPNGQASFANGNDDLSDLFSPSVLGAANNSTTSTENFNAQNQQKAQHSETNTASPCSTAAHSSLNGFTSSCATTPESSAQSPDQRKNTEASFNSEDSQRRKSASQDAFCKDFQTACGNTSNPVPPMLADSNTSPASASSSSNQPNTPGLDSNTFDWFANQNGGAFDPVLFGDYREPQDNVLNGDFGFFDNAFSMPEFNSPAQPLEPALPKKKDLMQQIEDTQAGKETEVVPGDNPKQFLTCNMLWDRVQRSQRVQSGEADMDDLCSQLKAKAKCSGNGAVIEQKDVDAILGPAPDDTKDFFKMFK